MALDYRQVLEGFADTVVAADRSGRVVYANPAAERLLGWSPAELVGRSLTLLMPPRMHAAHSAGFARYLATREPHLLGGSVHVPALRRDGSEIDIELSLSAVRGDDGEEIFIASMRDIRERVELERQLAVTRYLRAATAAAARLTSHLDLEQVIGVVVDTLVADFDAALARIWLYNPVENGLHLRASAGLSREVASSSRAHIDLASYPYKIGEVVRTRKPFIRNGLAGDPQFDQQWVAREGIASVAVFPLLIGGELRGVFDYFSRRTLPEEVVEVLGTFAAIAAASINDAQLLLREQEARVVAERDRDFAHTVEERLRRVLQNMPVMLDALDREGSILVWNRECEEVTGYTSAEIVGNPRALEILYPDSEYREQMLAAWTERGNDYRNWEWNLTAKDGSTRTVAWSNISDQFPVPGWPTWGIGVDVTERRRAEGALKEADRRKDESLAMLAHELRNPLAPIRNAAQLLRLQGSGDPALLRITEIVERQVRHMARLVDDLLDVSRITGGKIELRMERVELTFVIRQALESVTALIESREHELLELPTSPLWLEADPVRLEQIIQNLVENAAKYTEPAGQIGISAAGAGDEILLRVWDTGVGIAPELLPRVFDLFTQAQRPLDRTQGGLGLGLTLVRRLVQMHGGTITAASAGPGAGSEFVVRLPRAPAHSRAIVSAGHSSVEANISARRVLIVDDNRDAAVSLADLLRAGGHTVQVAHSGATALEVAATFQPEVVLLDIGLPGMDGYEVARRLRQRPLDKGVVLVALTGYGQEEDRRRCQEAGFDHHLVKPVEPDLLDAVLASVPEAG